MTKLYTLGLFSLGLATFVACDKGNGTSPNEDESSSSSVPSFKSSSSFSERADIEYKGEIVLGDTMRINVELFSGDSTEMDSSEVYIDSSAKTLPMYLGYLLQGSRIKIAANTSSIENDQIRVKSESGEYLDALVATKKAKTDEDSSFTNFFVPSLGSDTTAIFKDSNEFVVLKDNHYFVEVGGDFNDNSTFRMRTTVDTSYYQCVGDSRYVGDSTSVNMKTTDTIRGIISIDNAPKFVGVSFAATEGFSVNLNTEGTNITRIRLNDGDKELGIYESNVDTLLVPNDSTKWVLQVSPIKLLNYKTGPYAYFTATTKSRALEQGEYFAKPDSVKMPGEIYLRTRPKDDPNKAIYKYNLRQEQFVWIGNFKKGDSVRVKHGIYNYEDDLFKSQVTLEILDKNQKKLFSVNPAYGSGFSITEDMPEGPYYLHYLRLNSAPLEQVRDSLRYVLQLHTLVQHMGSVESMDMVNINNDGKVIDKVTLELGSKIALDDFVFYMEAKKEKGWEEVGDKVNWFVPCNSLDIINSNYKVADCEANGSEQEISADYLTVLNNEDNVRKVALLIAESVADPSMRDTLSITVRAVISSDD